MNEIRLCIDGGGKGKADSKRRLREALGSVFSEPRQRARGRGIQWHVPVYGSREEACVRTGGQVVEDVADDQLHLRTGMMEAWIVAGPGCLGRFHGRGFQAGALPRRADVEQIPKEDLIRGLRQATQRTSAGTCTRGRHAPRILAIVDPARVRSRAPRCEALFRKLTEAIA